MAAHIFYKDRDFRLADSIVLKTLEIIEYFQPTIWTIENPQTGYLKSRSFMQGLDYVDTDYCMYGSTMKKRTRFWSNHKFIFKTCKKDCNSLLISSKGRLVHGNWNTFGRAKNTCSPKSSKLSTASKRAIIPHPLCKSIIKQVKTNKELAQISVPMKMEK